MHHLLKKKATIDQERVSFYGVLQPHSSELRELLLLRSNRDGTLRETCDLVREIRVIDRT